MKTFISNKGYERVKLRKLGNDFKFVIHRLVGIHFIKNPDNKKQINHKDGNKLNNYVTNLEWCTSQENIIHSFKTGLNKGSLGIINGSAKLTEMDIIKIRKLLKEKNITQVNIALQFKVSTSLISIIKHNKIWQHVK